MAGMIRGIAHLLNIKVRVGADWDSDGNTKDNSFDDLVHFELLDWYEKNKTRKSNE